MASKNRSPVRADPARSKASIHKTISPFSYPVASSFKQFSSSHEQALQSLLKAPIRFVLATSLTFDDEENMAPVLRPRKRLNETREQRENRTNVSRSISKIFGRHTHGTTRSITYPHAGWPSSAGIILPEGSATEQGQSAT